MGNTCNILIYKSERKTTLWRHDGRIILKLTPEKHHDTLSIAFAAFILWKLRSFFFHKISEYCWQASRLWAFEGTSVGPWKLFMNWNIFLTRSVEQWAGLPRFDSRNGKWFFSFPQRPYYLWGPSSLINVHELKYILNSVGRTMGWTAEVRFQEWKVVFLFSTASILALGPIQRN
jgi:hypothetical protein